MLALRRLMPLAAALFLCNVIAAGADTPATPSSSQFVVPLVLRGTLGDVQVQVNLRPKPDIKDGLEGDYFVFGRSQKILLAGEVEGSDLFLEESENGIDVSGHWNGSFSGDAISGDWQSADGSVSKPFALKTVRAGRNHP
jgi:hypothetical protein